MKTIIVAIVGFLLAPLMLCATAFDTSYALSERIFDDVPFIRHEGPDYGSYLAQNVTFAPIDALKMQLARDFGVELKGRGEAHITVITPVEYQAFKSIVDIGEINDLVQNQIQNARFTPLCIGQGRLDDAMTFFVVVESSDLLAIRQSIETLVKSRGGDVSNFDAATFYPHITIGFTDRDLHAQDGVIKDQRSCIADVVIERD